MTDAITNDEVLVHIGYHKTGTSYLQSKFFNPTRGFKRWPPNQRELHPHLIDLGPFQNVPEESLRAIASSHRAASAAGLRWVLSHERLSGHASSGGYDSGLIANRLKQLFPNAKILVGIREQETLIRSAYSQFVTEGGSLSLLKYLNDPQAPIRKRPSFSLRHFEFAPLIQRYRSLFSPEKVLVVPYEHFVQQPIESLNRIGRFALRDQWKELTKDEYDASRVNRGRSVITQTVRRPLNAMFLRTQFSNSGFVHLPKSIRLYEKLTERTDRFMPAALNDFLVRRQKNCVREFVGDYFKAFNQITSDLIDCDLRELGYQ